MAYLSISLLGTFQVLLYEKEVGGFDSDKVRALLAYLVIESDRPHRRGALASLLWPERPERTARHNLSQALFNLRTLLDDAAADDPPGGSALTVTRQTIQFSTTSDHWLDVAAFTSALAVCREHPHRRLDLCDPARHSEELLLSPGAHLDNPVIQRGQQGGVVRQDAHLAGRTRQYDDIHIPFEHRAVLRDYFTANWHGIIPCFYCTTRNAP